MIRQILLLAGLFISMQLAAQTGIGTTSPVNKFQIETSAAAPLTSGTGFNGNLRLGATGANQVIDFGLGTTYGWIQSRDKTNYGTNYMLTLNPNGGGVGVGTNAPETQFHIKGGYLRVEYANPVYIDLKQSNAAVDKKITRIGNDNGTMIFDRVNDSYNTSSESMRIDLNGNVGIGTNAPAAKLHVNGDIIANSIAGNSDIRFKTNIRPVTRAIDKVKLLQGVYFNWNQKAFPNRDFGTQDELGFIAQEVEKIVPEIVTKDTSKEAYRSVKYDKLVALLVEAIKEQQKQIDTLNNRINKLIKKINK